MQVVLLAMTSITTLCINMQLLEYIAKTTVEEIV